MRFTAIRLQRSSHQMGSRDTFYRALGVVVGAALTELSTSGQTAAPYVELGGVGTPAH